MIKDQLHQPTHVSGIQSDGCTPSVRAGTVGSANLGQFPRGVSSAKRVDKGGRLRRTPRFGQFPRSPLKTHAEVFLDNSPTPGQREGVKGARTPAAYLLPGQFP